MNTIHKNIIRKTLYFILAILLALAIFIPISSDLPNYAEGSIRNNLLLLIVSFYVVGIFSTILLAAGIQLPKNNQKGKFWSIKSLIFLLAILLGSVISGQLIDTYKLSNSIYQIVLVSAIFLSPFIFDENK